MAKVFPCTPHSSSERERYTVWLKSLVLNGNGCTVFDSNGQIAYRVDNYESKCSNQIYLMDIQGNVICAILRKKWQLYGCWNGYSCDDPKMKNEKPWFQVRRQIKLLKGGSVYHVTVKRDPAQASFYKIEGVARKLAFKITDLQQRLMAEAKRKQCSSGVVLGADVLSLVVEPQVDHSLVIALVAFYGLVSPKL